MLDNYIYIMHDYYKSTGLVNSVNYVYDTYIHLQAADKSVILTS